MNLRNDWYYDPPDEQEQDYCESCGKEMNYVDDEPVCRNKYCPDKVITSSMYKGDFVLELCRTIVDLEESKQDYRDRLRWAEGHKKQFLEIIEELRNEIEVLKGKEFNDTRGRTETDFRLT